MTTSLCDREALLRVVRVFCSAIVCCTGNVSGQPVERPQWKVGDRWVFKQSTAEAPDSEWSREVVAHTSRDEFKVKFDNQILTTYDNQGNRLNARGPEYTAKYFVFPMDVGSRWTNDVKTAGDLWTGNAYSTWSVEDREKIIVPAGTFDCLRLEGRVWWAWTDGQQVAQSFNKGNSAWTYWYCPEVQWFAKERIRTQPVPWLPYTLSESVLISFTRAP